MKQAILITAYKNIPQIKNILDFFDDEFSFYIHIDAKSVCSEKDIEALESKNTVKLISRKYRVNWGGTNHLKAILHLCEECLKNESPEYIHLITGQDFPIKKTSYFSEYLTKNKGTEYLVADKLPNKKWKDGGLNRISYYHLYDTFNSKNWQRLIIKGLVKLQKIFGLKRVLPTELESLYGGVVYWTLSKEAVQYVLDFLSVNPDLLKRFKYTFCSEEFLFPSILMNSKFGEKITGYNLRFMVWEHRDGVSPANLDERDYENITSSDALFARKFEFPTSNKLYEMIRDEIDLT